MPVYTESELSISLPDGKSFQLGKMAAYRSLSGCALKEMDFGYLDEDGGHIVLVELTSYNKAAEPPTSKVLLPEMIAKARDSLLMLQAAWRGHGVGKRLLLELPEPCRKELRLRICFVVKLSSEHRRAFTPVAMSNIGGRLRTCLAACADLLGLEVHVELFDDRKAMEKLPITAPVLSAAGS